MHNCVSQNKLCRMAAFDTNDCVLFGLYQNINQPLESGKSGWKWPNNLKNKIVKSLKQDNKSIL